MTEITLDDLQNKFHIQLKLKQEYGHGGFPIELPEVCILLSTKKGQVVLDPFMGTGTTGVACKKHQRRFVGIDNIKEFVEYSKNRIKNTETKLKNISLF